MFSYYTNDCIRIWLTSRVQYMVELLVIDPSLDQAIDLFDGLFNLIQASALPGGWKRGFHGNHGEGWTYLETAVHEKE